MAMDVHWIDVKLRDGRRLYKLVVRGGRYITGRDTDPDGEGELDFNANDLVKVRRQAIVKWWPFW